MQINNSNPAFVQLLLQCTVGVKNHYADFMPSLLETLGENNQLALRSADVQRTAQKNNFHCGLILNLNTNSLHPCFPPHVTNSVNEKPRLLKKRKISSGVATNSNLSSILAHSENY